MRLILDKIFPIEEKLKHQIEKIVNVSAAGGSDTNDKTNYRANVADLEVSSVLFMRINLVLFMGANNISPFSVECIRK